MSTAKHSRGGRGRPRFLSASTAAAAATAAAGFAILVPAAAQAASPAVSVFPIAGGRVATPATQLTFRGIPASSLGTITVTGSDSGAHPGTIAGDSDGMGGSFLPAKGFDPGETVTVRTRLNIVGGRNGTYRFTVATPARKVSTRPLPAGSRTAHDVWNYVSRPDLKPAALTVDKLPAKSAAPGAIFLASQAGPVNNGPEILGPYGGLIWFDPVPRGTFVTDFRPQTYRGKPVLTWWQGNINMSGVGHGVDEIFSNDYRHLATVKAGNGIDSDLHEFQLTSQGTAWVTAYQPVVWNATKVTHGSKKEIVYDAIAQEIDVRTGLVLYQWDSLDHIALGASYSPVARHTGTPWDYFHINSIQPQFDGSIVISARNTSEIYKVSGADGSIIWTVGGKFPSFKMGPDTRFYFQHDARVQANGELTLFDDAGAPFQEKQSRALRLKLDTAARTVTLVSQYFHRPGLKAPAEGNNNLLSNGDSLVGWGQAPYITEFNAKGDEVFDAHFNSVNATYRAYKANWSGDPTTAPAVAAKTSHRRTRVWATWNGSTSLNRWRVLGGSSRRHLRAVGGGAKRSYETAFRLKRSERYVAVQALDRHGKVLRSSPTIKVS